MVDKETGASRASKHLAILGLSFRLDGLNLTEGVYVEIADMGEALSKHVRYEEPQPKGCAVYITEIAWAPDSGGWIRGHHQVERPYWFPKLVVSDLRQLQNDLDDLALLKLAKDAGWGPDLSFAEAKIGKT